MGNLEEKVKLYSLKKLSDFVRKQYAGVVVGYAGLFLGGCSEAEEEVLGMAFLGGIVIGGSILYFISKKCYKDYGIPPEDPKRFGRNLYDPTAKAGWWISKNPGWG
jgi:hypothetical protein